MNQRTPLSSLNKNNSKKVIQDINNINNLVLGNSKSKKLLGININLYFPIIFFRKCKEY